MKKIITIILSIMLCIGAIGGSFALAKHIDGWTDEPHLIAAAWNILWAIQMEIKHPELVDVPWEEPKKKHKWFKRKGGNK